MLGTAQLPARFFENKLHVISNVRNTYLIGEQYDVVAELDRMHKYRLGSCQE